MSRSSLWDRPALRFEELPNLQELFRTCDHRLLARVVIEDCACPGESAGSLGKKRRRAMGERVLLTLDAMASLDVDAKAIEHRVLVPEKHFVLNECKGMVARHLCATIAARPDVEDMKGRRRAMGGRATSCKQVRKADKRLHETGPDASRTASIPSTGKGSPSRGYALMPWEETLSCKVWLGGDWCRRERYSTLAGAFWEMTFYGFDYDRVQVRMAQEKEGNMDGKPADTGGRRVISARDGADSGGGSLDYDLREPDRFTAAYYDRLAEWVAVLNHNARYDFYGCQLDLARRLKMR